MIKNGNNSGTQWNTNKNVNIYINKLVIHEGKYQYTPSFTDKIKFALGIGPSERQIEAFIENTFGAVKAIDTTSKTPEEGG